MGKKKKHVPAGLYYLSYKNIREDIMRCGFEIKPVRMLLYYLITIACCVLVCIPFELSLISMVCISVTGILCVPIVLVSSYRRQYEERRFVEVSVYISQMLSAFSMNSKVLYALQSTQQAVTSAPMKQTVTEAADYILNTSISPGDIHEEALKIIEEKYYCKRIVTMHRFMLNVEKQGGKYKQIVSLLQRDRDLWEERVESFTKEEKEKKSDAVLSAGFIILMCWLTFVLGKNFGIDMVSAAAYQIATTLLIISEMLVYIKVNCPLNVDLLEKVSSRSNKSILKDYHMVVNYDRDRERVRSVRNSVIPVAIILAGVLLHGKVLPGIGVGSLLYVLFDKQLTYTLTVKELKREVAFAYPQWLMEMALLLQGNTVRNAIRLTVENAHPVLHEALEKMIEEFDKNPSSMEPYMNFLIPIRTKDVSTSMSMLYAAASGTNGDANERINEIIESTIKMTDKSEKLENEDRLLGLDLWFKAPAIPGTITILVYAVIFMLGTLNTNAYMR